MSSNGSSISEKPKGVESDSSPGPIKPIGTPHVSSNHSIGDLHSKRDKGGCRSLRSDQTQRQNCCLFRRLDRRTYVEEPQWCDHSQHEGWCLLRC
ncbi:unnamed protein product [Brassica napus]|uniref:(rape) hypothetical protein n=1 Tax=Brassica napus TaxID=3708 RepID=A0A816YUT9_BRANA|nr:unnamed protein product [Brassica napus]